MAEIRKHQPQVDNPIDAALLAALGEPVRPVQPGRRPAIRPDEDAAERRPQAPSPHGLSGSPIPMGGQWLQVNPAPVRPKGTQPVERPAAEES